MHNFRSAQYGFGMVEIIIGAAVLSVSLLGIANFFQSTLVVSRTTSAMIQGGYLLEEGVEVVKLFRDEDYSSNISQFSTTTPTYLIWNGTAWATTTVNTFIDGKFERSIIAGEVARYEGGEAGGDIAPSGVFDPNTKLITVTVAWQTKGATTTKTIQTYVTNIFND